MERLGLQLQEVEPLIGRLVIFASHLMRRLTWRGATVSGGGTVPGGYEPGDFVADAVTKSLDGTRLWNRGCYPTAERFLQSIIKSDINHLAVSSDNERGRRMWAPSGADETTAAYDIPTPDPKPLQVIIDGAELAAYRKAVLGELSDDALLIGLFHCYEAEVTEPHEIAQRLGQPVAEIYNAKKRLRRKLEKIDMRLLPARRQERRIGS